MLFHIISIIQNKNTNKEPNTHKTDKTKQNCTSASKLDSNFVSLRVSLKLVPSEGEVAGTVASGDSALSLDLSLLFRLPTADCKIALRSVASS
jgi:hypothetical protein